MGKYLSLNRYYHDKDLKEQYNDKYRERFYGENTYRLPLWKNDTQIFAVITTDIYEKSIRIYDKNRQLSELASLLPGAALNGLLLNRILIDELQTTNKIEGIYSTRKEIEEAIDANIDTKKAEKQQNIRMENQVKQYVKILRGKKFDIKTAQDIRDLYDDFLQNEIDKDNMPDGKLFRKDEVYVFSQTGSGKPVHKGLTSEESIIQAVDKWIMFLHDKSYPALLRIAVGHYYFGYIHPFYDGNGRIGRLISSILLADELNVLLALRLSFTISEEIKAYYKNFDETNNILNKGDATLFFDMFLDILEQALDELLEDLNDKKNKLDLYYQLTHETNDLDKDEQEMIFILAQGILFSNKHLNRDVLRNNMKVSPGKLKKILERLEAKGYIKEDKSHRKFKYILLEEKLKPINE